MNVPTLPRSGNYLVDMYDDRLDAEERHESKSTWETENDS